MEYSLLQLSWLFFIYSLIGWIAEVCIAAISKKKFINRGFVNGPLCPIYGFGAILFALFLPELTDNVFFLFIGGVVLATVLELSTGMFFEKVFHEKLWDYSGIRFNLDGYICLRYSLLWGVFAVLLMKYVNPFICFLVNAVPLNAAAIILWFASVLLLLDFISTALAVFGMLKAGSRLAQFSKGIQNTSKFLENAMTMRIQSRMMRSFPAINIESLTGYALEKNRKKTQPKVFADSLSFYKMFCIFFISSFLGDITETIYCLITTHKLMSRSSLVYGPFSIVWGLACVLLTALLYRYRNNKIWHIYIAGVILGGAYEYICSIFTELVFGTIFWDYSGFIFNLGGRINLLYCFFWGFAAIAWFKVVYPFLSNLIEKIPVKTGTIICNILLVFMIYNMLISSLALYRYTERNTGSVSAYVTEDTSFINNIKIYLDKHFHNERMERIYPNVKIVNAQ